MTWVEELAKIARLSTPLLGDLKALDAAIAEAIRQALTEALGPPTPEMVRPIWDNAKLTIDEIADIWTAMAAVRLRDVLSGAKDA